MDLQNKFRLLLNRPDATLFWLMWTIHLIPIWLFTPFLTVDGPAHLHNARLLLELWRSNPYVADFYVVNPALQPNMLAHLLLAALMAAGMPAQLAEKILLSLVVGLFPLAFRHLLNACRCASEELVLMVFPFVYGFLFFMGFYNFLLGMVVALYGLGLWIRLLQGDKFRLLPVLILVSGLLSLLAHLYVFAWYAVFSGLILFVHIIRPKSIGATAYPLWILLVIWLLPILPAIYLVANGQFSGGESQRLRTAALWRIIYEVQPAKGLEYGKANIYTQWLFGLLVLRFLLAVFEVLRGRLSTTSIVAGVALFMLSLALFVLPDGNALAGVVSQRTGLMWFLALLVLLAGFETQLWMRWLSRMVAIVTSISLLLLYGQALSHDQPVARAVALAARQVPAGAVVYVENTSDRMLHTHVSNYLGATKGVIVSENYQAALPYFPVKWNLRNLPVLHLGEMSKPVKAWPVAGGLRNRQADFVLVITSGNESPEKAGNLADQHYFKGLYAPVYQNDKKTVSLFVRLPISIFDL
ncbi:MAG: hypothetical protein IPM52_09895 [Bacteroidetes bacterium]|nr:hypothetical protein [Bacteroidota bacterium]